MRIKTIRLAVPVMMLISGLCGCMTNPNPAPKRDEGPRNSFTAGYQALKAMEYSRFYTDFLSAEAKEQFSEEEHMKIMKGPTGEKITAFCKSLNDAIVNQNAQLKSEFINETSFVLELPDSSTKEEKKCSKVRLILEGGAWRFDDFD